jgi:hypothetical protein
MAGRPRYLSGSTSSTTSFVGPDAHGPIKVKGLPAACVEPTDTLVNLGVWSLCLAVVLIVVWL